MIGRIRGALLEKHAGRLLVECHGVGYELEVSMTTLWSMPDVGQEVTLHTQIVVREDAQLLFGFATLAERRLFQSLLKVNGVGARMALTILSGIQPDEFVVCIQRGDAARLTRLPGIGKRTAERLVVEMKDRVADGAEAALPPVMPGGGAAAPPPDAVADAVAGLIALGYKPQEASRLVYGVDTAGKTSEALIREVLRSLARG